MIIVIMGVAGAGKTTIGETLKVYNPGAQSVFYTEIIISLEFIQTNL
jgi:adenylate kinase